VMAFIMTVFMLSLVGIPLTSGFIGKWLVFQATINAGLYWLAIVGVLTSVISAFYYVRVIVNMYLRDKDGDTLTPGETPRLTWAIYLSFAGTVIMGIFPSLVTDLSNMVNFTATVVR